MEKIIILLKAVNFGSFGLVETFFLLRFEKYTSDQLILVHIERKHVQTGILVTLVPAVDIMPSNNLCSPWKVIE